MVDIALRPYLLGDRPRVGLAVAGTVFVACLVLFAVLGLSSLGGRGAGGALFGVAFGALPGVAGVVCGRARGGLPTAALSGLAPGVAFYVAVAVGAALGLGSFGGGDSPLAGFALALASIGFVWAAAGFAAGVAVAVYRA